MLYHYWGNKEALYSAVLLDAYQEIRRGERELTLSQFHPVEAIDRMVRFTFRHFLANPWFPRLLAVENLQNARFLKQIKDLPALHSPLVAELRDILERGHKLGVFRTDVDPMQLYISIAGAWLLLRLQHEDAVGDLRPRPQPVRDDPGTRSPGRADGARLSPDKACDEELDLQSPIRGQIL